MTNKNLLQEAIAEAKTIRQAAITNAKEALEESLTPHLKEMLAKKLQEMDEADNEEVVDENINSTEDEHELINSVNEEEEAEEEMPAEEPVEDETPSEEPTEEELDFENMTRDDFKNLLTDLMGEIEAEKSEEVPGEEMADDNAIDLDEPSDDDEINIDELLAELAGEEVKEDLFEAKKKAAKEKEKKAATKKEEDKDLKEALDTVNILRTQLQEVNLLNAKLLYVNKVFKSTNLTESQKVNVVAAFDKAETVKEVKLVFETVSKNVVTKKPSTIKEHTSFASKPTGTTAAAPKEIINEVSEQVLRMQKLAGIIK